MKQISSDKKWSGFQLTQEQIHSSIVPDSDLNSSSHVFLSLRTQPSLNPSPDPICYIKSKCTYYGWLPIENITRILEHCNQLAQIQSIQATFSNEFKDKPANHLTSICLLSLPCIPLLELKSTAMRVLRHN